MKTAVVRDVMATQPKDILHAAQILRAGGLVAFPTETVYGLGADATNPRAVEKIFIAKGRPPTNPLIAHVADVAVARKYAAIWPEAAQRLAERFWPGPLTIIVPKHRSIAPEATAGLDTVGLRCPDHPLALALLRDFAGPVAAPSANRSTRVSPTTAQHVREEIGANVDFILDGGPCRVGIESTVLDLVSDPPRILRPGAVTARQISLIIGPVLVVAAKLETSERALSPGQQPLHYAPRTPAYRFERDELHEILRDIKPTEPAAILLIGTSDNATVRPLPHIGVIHMPEDPAAYARRLYAVLRELDAQNVHAILIEMPPPTPPWLAVRDRLLRATSRSR